MPQPVSIPVLPRAMLPATLCTLWFAPLAAQANASLPAVRDNALYSNSVDLSSGQGYLASGRTMRFGVRRALVLFDVAAAVPAGSKITGVTLTMSSPAVKVASLRVDLHRLTSSWGEGTSAAFTGAGDRATTGDATWAHRFFKATSWARPGGEFVQAASGGTLVSVGTNAWSSSSATSARMVADVQSWLDDPGRNHGWILLGDETRTSAALYRNRESSLGPRLGIVFTPPPALANKTGRGCGPHGPNGVTLDAVGLPRLGNRAFALVIADGPPSGRAFLFLAGSLARSPLPFAGGCNVYLDPSGLLLYQTAGLSPLGPFGLDAQGRFTLRVPLGNQAALLGSTHHAQAAVPSMQAPAGFYLANALSLRVGL